MICTQGQEGNITNADDGSGVLRITLMCVAPCVRRHARQKAEVRALCARTLSVPAAAVTRSHILVDDPLGDEPRGLKRHCIIITARRFSRFHSPAAAYLHVHVYTCARAWHHQPRFCSEDGGLINIARPASVVQRLPRLASHRSPPHNPASPTLEARWARRRAWGRPAHGGWLPLCPG